MELTYNDLDDGVRKIAIIGRLDIEGAGAIDLRFTALTSTARSFVIVDLEGVEFLASLGIATLVRNAKAVRLRGGNLVLLNPRPNVAHVLATMRIGQLLPIYSTFEEAHAAVRAAPPSLT